MFVIYDFYVFIGKIFVVNLMDLSDLNFGDKYFSMIGRTSQTSTLAFLLGNNFDFCDLDFLNFGLQCRLALCPLYEFGPQFRHWILRLLDLTF